jgi:hypothetical protein
VSSCIKVKGFRRFGQLVARVLQSEVRKSVTNLAALR